MRLVGFVDDELVARKILGHLGMLTRAPPRGQRHRGPQTELQLDLAPTDADGIDPPLVLD
jgi:hypothetical protein